MRMEYYVHGHARGGNLPPQVSSIRFKFPDNLTQKDPYYWMLDHGAENWSKQHISATPVYYPKVSTMEKLNSEQAQSVNCCQKRLKKYVQNVQQSWLLFCSTTTGHGLARTVDDREYVWVRWLWAVLVTSLFGLLLASVTQSSINVWLGRSLHSELSQVTNETMYFPDIHICDTSIFDKSRLTDMGFNDTMSTYLALALTVTAPAHVFRLNAPKRIAFAKELDQMTKPYGGIYNVLQKASLSCMEMVLGCIRLTMRMTAEQCCSQFFGNQTELNIMGICISTHGQVPIDEYVPSQSLGFVVYLRTNAQNRVEFDMNIVTATVPSRSGIVFAISDPISDLQAILPTQGQYVSPGSWAAIPISITKIDNSELSGATLSPMQCIHSTDPTSKERAPGFENYSEMNCRAAGVQWLLETSLNCTLMSVASLRNLPKCSPEVLVSYFSSDAPKKLKEYEETHCLVDCVVYNYESKVSTAKLEFPAADVAKGWDDRTAAGLHFFFPTFTYMVTINHPETLIKWLGDIGGNMGFYMGASIVTVMEVLVLTIKCLLVSCCRDPVRAKIQPSSEEKRQRSHRRRSLPTYHLD